MLLAFPAGPVNPALRVDALCKEHNFLVSRAPESAVNSFEEVVGVELTALGKPNFLCRHTVEVNHDALTPWIHVFVRGVQPRASALSSRVKVELQNFSEHFHFGFSFHSKNPFFSNRQKTCLIPIIPVLCNLVKHCFM